MKKILRNIVFILFWLILILPVIQLNSKFLKVSGLRGAGDTPSYPAFTLKKWFKGEFQQQFNQAYEETIGFRPWMIRYKNQIEYSLGRKANASGVIIGKQGYLFEKDYIRAHQGTDYLGDYYWSEKFRRLAMVTDTLQKLGTNFFLVLEPGKASYYPEYIPDRYEISAQPGANYHAIIKHSLEEDIPLLDLNKYYVDLKAVPPYPLFPKGGIHWSTAGVISCLDTMLRFMDHHTRFDFPETVVDNLNYSGKLENTDDDLVQILNLMWPPPHEDMAYPDFHFEGSDTLIKPRVLSISDSFYFNILNGGYADSLFANKAFWYYNKTIYPETWAKETLTQSLDILETVKNMDIVLLMVTERFYYKFDWDFTDDLYERFYPHHEQDYYYDYFRMIIRNYVWFDDIYAQSLVYNQSMENRLADHAGYQFWVDDQKEKFPRDLPYYRMKIRTDRQWYQEILHKAKLNQRTVDEQVELDAVWMLSQDSK